MNGDNYLIWNRLIVEHFLHGRQQGLPVFLSFDDESADLIAFEIDDATGAPQNLIAPTDRLLSAVKDALMRDGTVRFDLLPKSDVPAGVAFLCVMVLAAHRMIDDAQAPENAYFIRLGNLLGTTNHRAGLDNGAEEDHWLEWNTFLDRKGFVPTALAGEGPMRYLRYAISQAILRDCDRQYLTTTFNENSVPQGFDHSQLGFWLSGKMNRVYVREGLEHFDAERRSEFLNKAYGVYEAYQHSASGAPGTSTPRMHPTRTLEAGLYRECDVQGIPRFYLLPSQPMQFKSRPLSLLYIEDRAPVQLRNLRPGFYRPVGPQDPFVCVPLELQVNGDSRVTSMLFPKRDFWVLTEDPEDPDGCYATWARRIEVGQRFVLLCCAGLLVDEMQRLRNPEHFNGAGLINWTEKRDLGNQIVEFVGCMVLNYEIRAYMPTSGCEALVDALMPRSGFSVSLAGGLRDPNQSAWLEGYPPSIRAHGFTSRVRVQVKREGAEPWQSDSQDLPNGQALPLPDDLKQGNYVIFAESEGITTRRHFRIIPWGAMLAPQEPDYLKNPDPLATASLGTCGAAFLDDPLKEEWTS